MAFLWRITLALFIFCVIVSKYGTEASTRWQPSIIWNRFNPLLTCKCNWMNIPELAIYDRVELLCPKSYLVSAFRKEDMAKREVYYNIFSRKYNYSKDPELNDLRRALENGSFCNTTDPKTKKLYTCRRDDAVNTYTSYRLRFHSDEDLHAGEIVVFFSNKKTGLESDLASKETKCAMVFVVNIIDVPKSEKDEYDLSYGKCFDRDEDCKYGNISSCPRRNCANNPSYRNHTIYKNNTRHDNQTTFRNNTIYVNLYNSALKSSNDEFHPKSFGAGFGTATLLIFVLAVVLYVIVVKIKGKLMCVEGSQEVEAQMKKQASGGQNFEPVVTVTTPVNSENEAVNINHENDIKKDLSNGFLNKGFEPTPTAPPQEEHPYKIPNNPCSRNGRLPSVDGARALPPLKYKQPTQLPS